MEITCHEFKRTTKTFIDALKHTEAASINLPFYLYGSSLKELFTLSRLVFRNVAKMYEFLKYLPVQPSQVSMKNFQQHAGFLSSLLDSSEEQKTLGTIAATQEYCKTFQSVRLLPDAIPEVYRPFLIRNAPIETTEGDRTYRAITWTTAAKSLHELVYMACDRDTIYDYLDKGYFIMFSEQQAAKNKLEKCVVVADRYDVNTAHIFALCRLQPSLSELLKNKCFAGYQDAEMLKLRMLKKLNTAHKAAYQAAAEKIEIDYHKNSTLILLSKLLDGSVAKTTLNEIEFTKTSATYERISVEHDSLLVILQNSLNFNGEFDIYGICDILGKEVQKISDEAERPAEGEPKLTLANLKINSIPIHLELSYTGCRYINSVRVNKDELGAAVARASCYQDEAAYKVFLETIRALSIKHHDIIANGLAVKIHSTITPEEYRSAQPGPNAPAIKFKIDKESRRVHLEISENRSVPVHFQRIINRVNTLNERTNNASSYKKDGPWGHTRVTKNYRWAAKEMVEILISACTAEEEHVNEAGNKIKTKKVLITENDVVLLLDAANDKKNEAIARSKEFMAMAVKSTGATMVEFLGKPAYKVSGNLRTYAVIIESAKVYDFDTKKYRCIVNHNHYQGAGYDDVATRLLALKNDSVMQQAIGTLQGEAQPQYEPNGNTNDHEREGFSEFDVRAAIGNAFSAA
jgi:hypothetical protein